MKMRMLSALLAVAVFAGFAKAHPVVDGTLGGDEAAYRSALFVQNTLTQFGDNANPDPKVSFQGSELDAIYATVRNGRLYVMITGNLETGSVPVIGGNWNKMEIFIDSVSGGWNTIPVDTYTNGGSTFFNEIPEVDPWSREGGPSGFGALQVMADPLTGNGLTFDQGFEADYYITFSNGFETEQTSGNFPQEWAFTPHFSPLDTLVSFGGSVPDQPTADWGALGGNTAAGVVGGTLIDQNDPIINDFDNFWTERDTDNSVVQMEASFDNSNTAGIVGSGGPDFAATQAEMDAAAAVMTGIEFSIPLSAIGSPTGDIRISAFINGGAHDYVSNQITGGILQGNLGGDNSGGFDDSVADVNFDLIDGDQYVTIAQFNDADFNEDGTVDGNDFLIWQAGFNMFEGDASKMDGDANGDHLVDGNDFLIWQANFGSAGGSGSGAVPEPSSVLLVLIGGVLAGLATRRR